MCLNPINQDHWDKIVDESIYTKLGVSKKYGINLSSLNRYLTNKSTPRDRNREIMEEIMRDLLCKKRVRFHQSYGFATDEEISILRSVGIGPERDAVLSKIKDRSKTGGKVKV